MARFETCADALLLDIPRSRTGVLPALLRMQRAFGYVSDQSIASVARHVRLTRSDVEGIASGYPELRREPLVGVPVRVCMGLSCAMEGARELHGFLDAHAAQLGIDLGTSPCLFLCAQAPAVEILDECLGRATVESVRARIVAVPGSSQATARRDRGDFGQAPDA